jgi:hypothetical protein
MSASLMTCGSMPQASAAMMTARQLRMLKSPISGV